MKLNELRNEYADSPLLESGIPTNPFELFSQWFAQAVDSGAAQPDAFSISTVGTKGKPESRIVLLKGFTEDGFRFFTDYASHKGQQLDQNPQAELLFYWPTQERQIRISTNVAKVPESVSDQQFAQRPRGSQISAIVSAQSAVINGRGALEKAYRAIEALPETEIQSRPQNWGGYLCVPTQFEFWQGRPNRLNDRIVYKLEQHVWNTYRLAP